MGGIRKIMVFWQAVFLAASPLVTAPPSSLTRLYYNGSAAKSHSITTQYRQLCRLVNYKINEGHITPTPRYGKDFCIPSAISSGYAMLMSPNEDEAAVHGCHCRVNMVGRMRKVLATRRSWYVCFSAEIGIIQYHRGYL